ncbi:hypothetical protein B0H67DRAFT_640464 [Lasiosphaeris hirsuta]|uniref:Uncharacterized protein n=1 Tax=Lasiosphaeris hirsuta TaxID=260670 RepID=A0AA40BDB1_9PEZI|nr:hypothetical protein B0H67DRAFT_640464 [Lasiosphaeris hirsuta]
MRFWKWEILAVFVAGGSIAAIIFLLVYFDGRRVPEWPYTINLTTLVSIIMTVFKAALLATVAEIISQEKWTWFQKGRRLIDLQRFDEASRGSLGSLKFFATIPKTVIATLAAAVTLVSLAIGPFSQQAIKTVTCQQSSPSGVASIPVANIADGGSFRYGAGLYRLYPDVQAALINGLTNPLGEDSAMAANCSTGNCTFPEYNAITHSTIGLCSACVDLTGQISAKNANYTLPGGGLYVSPEEQKPVLNIQDNDLKWLPVSALGNTSTEFGVSLNNMTLLLFTTAACALSPDSPRCANNVNVPSLDGGMRPLAISCALYPCVKNYHGFITNNRLTETLISTVPASPAAEIAPLYSTNTFHSHTVLKTPCAINTTLYTPTTFASLGPPHLFEPVLAPDGVPTTAPLECIYKLYWVLAAALASHLRDALLAGSCVATLDAPRTLHCPDAAFWLNAFWADGGATATSVGRVVDGLAAAATAQMRLRGHSLYASTSGGSDVRPDVLGTAVETTVCVRFEWAWLALPVGLLVLAALLLAAVIGEGYGDGRVPVWKGSVLPLLFCGFVERVRVEGVPDAGEMERMAKGMRVVMTRDGGVAGLADA